MSRALCNAGKTACALGIINLRQIVFHCNRAVRANFSTQPAGYTADLAHAHNVLALAL